MIADTNQSPENSPARLHSSPAPQLAARRQSRAFTVKELLVVVAVLTLLVCVHLSALTNASNQSKVAQCAANLKQLILAMQVFGNDGNEAVPRSVGNSWPWAFAAVSVDVLQTNYGLNRASMYCPGFPQQNIDQMWNYSVTYTQQGVPLNGFRVVGYAAAFLGSRVFSDDYDTNWTQQRYTLSGSDPSQGPAGATIHINPSKRVLLADATISSQGQSDPTQATAYQWTLHTDSGLVGSPFWSVTPYGPWKGSSTPHMGAIIPLGGNVAMLDGHVEWRPFTNMLPRTNDNPPGGDEFWW